MNNIQSRNIGGDGYDISVLYPTETIVGQLVLGDIMKDLSGQGLFYFFHLADVGGR